MEALTAVSVAALTVYDMCKAVDRGMVIGDVRLLHKAGGKVGNLRGPCMIRSPKLAPHPRRIHRRCRGETVALAAGLGR